MCEFKLEACHATTEIFFLLKKVDKIHKVYLVSFYPLIQFLIDLVFFSYIL